MPVVRCEEAAILSEQKQGFQSDDTDFVLTPNLHTGKEVLPPPLRTGDWVGSRAICVNARYDIIRINLRTLLR